MKWLKVFLISILLLFYTNVKAADFAYSSGVIASSGIVMGVPVLLTDLAVYTNGSADATVILYDSNTTATGTVIGKVVVLGASINGGMFIPIPVKTSKGIYISISGTGASAIVYWTPE